MEEHFKIKLNRHKAHDAVLIPERGLLLTILYITPKEKVSIMKDFLSGHSLYIDGSDIELIAIEACFSNSELLVETNINPN